MQDFHDRQADVETNQVSQRQRSHGVTGPQFHDCIDLVPAGHLPTWLVRWASTKVPYETLVNLEQQVSKTKGRYDRLMQAWSSAN